MKRYELTFFISPDLSEEELKGLCQNLADFIKKQGGSLEKTEEPLRKKLAHPIHLPKFSSEKLGQVKKKKEAFLTCFIFSFEPAQLSNLEKKLKSETQILRYIILIKKEAKKVSEKALKKAMLPEKSGLAQTEKIKKRIPDPKTQKVELKEIDQKIEEMLKE